MGLGAEHAAPASAPLGRTRRVVAAVLAALGVAWLVVGLLTLPNGEGWGFDYLCYRDGVVRYAEAGTFYQPDTVAGPFRPGPYLRFTYPPPAGVAMMPFGAVPFRDGALAWQVIHVLVLVAACAVMPISGTARLAVFGAAALSRAVTVDISLGNVSVILLLPLALAWRWLDRPAGGIAQAVALSLRPSLGIILVWQSLRRQWGAVAWTIAAGLALVLVTLPIIGIGPYVDYLAVLRNLSDTIGATGNHDLGSTALLMGFDEQAARMALYAGYALAIGAVLFSLRRDREVGYMVSVGASMLLAPVLWGHYLALVILPAALLLGRGQWWALALPFLTWVPFILQPFVVVAAMLAPLLARAPDLPVVPALPRPAAVESGHA